MSAKKEKQRFTRSGNLYGGTPPRSHLLLRKRPWASGPFSPEHVLFSRGVHIGMVAPMASGRTVRIIKSLQRE